MRNQSCWRKVGKMLLVLVVAALAGCASGSDTMLRGEADLKLQQQNTFVSTMSEVSSEKVPLGAGDEIEVIVWKQEGLNRKYRIDKSGIIFFPLIGNIKVDGMSSETLRLTITEGLSDYLVDPQINVNIIRQRYHKLYVMGEVRKPGILIIEDEMNIVEALLMAGGMTLDADRAKIIVIRKIADSIELRRVNIKQLLEKGDETQFIRLSKNDIVYVPPSFIANVDRFFEHVGKIFSPIVDIERSIILGNHIKEIFEGEDNNNYNIVISP